MEFENAGFSVYVEGKHFENGSFRKRRQRYKRVIPSQRFTRTQIQNDRRLWRFFQTVSLAFCGRDPRAKQKATKTKQN